MSLWVEILIGLGAGSGLLFALKLWSRREYLRKAWQIGKADPTGYIRGAYNKELGDD